MIELRIGKVWYYGLEEIRWNFFEINIVLKEIFKKLIEYV